MRKKLTHAWTHPVVHPEIFFEIFFFIASLYISIDFLTQVELYKTIKKRVRHKQYKEAVKIITVFVAVLMFVHREKIRKNMLKTFGLKIYHDCKT